MWKNENVYNFFAACKNYIKAKNTHFIQPFMLDLIGQY